LAATTRFYTMSANLLAAPGPPVSDRSLLAKS
jgi:hypothetical protein